MYNTTNDHVSKKPAFIRNNKVVSKSSHRKQIGSNRSVATARKSLQCIQGGWWEKQKFSGFRKFRKIFQLTESLIPNQNHRSLDHLIRNRSFIANRGRVLSSPDWARVNPDSGYLVNQPSRMRRSNPYFLDSLCSIEGSWIIWIESFYIESR